MLSLASRALLRLLRRLMQNLSNMHIQSIEYLCDVLDLVRSQCRSPWIVCGFDGDYSEFRERIKNATDIAFHRMNEKHFRKLIDEVRQLEKSLSSTAEMRRHEFSLQIGANSTHADQRRLRSTT